MGIFWWEREAIPKPFRKPKDNPKRHSSYQETTLGILY